MGAAPPSQKKGATMAKNRQLEGEGSYRGTRSYDSGVREKIARGEVERAAVQAEQAVENRREELRQAEEKAKRGPVTKKDEPQKQQYERAVQRAENEGMLPTP
jgi:hypothetical protein